VERNPLHDDAAFRTLARRLRELGDAEAAEVLAALVAGLSVDAAGMAMERIRPTATLDYDPHPIRLLVSSQEIGLRLVSAEKEPFTVEWIERSLEGGQVFYDIGANVGAYSLIAAKTAPEGVRVFAFEPSPASFLDLSRNVALNECSHIVTALPLALWSRADVLALTPGETAAGAASRPTVAGAAEHDMSPHRTKPSADSVPIVGVPLDDLVERFGLPVPTHAKIDTDGYELEVLAGAERTLARKEWESIHVELDREETSRNDQIRRLLADAGFVRQRQHDRMPTPAFPDPAGRPDVYWTFSRGERRRPVIRRAGRRRALHPVGTSPVRAAQRRAVTATLALMTALFLLLVLLPEELGDRPYDVFGLRF
jgi:FkbM family methyltransferase